MLTPAIEKALNEQLNKEFYSAYLYLAMSAYCAHRGFNGAANWFRQQYKEEEMHGMKMYDYIINRDGKVTLAPVEGPANDYGSMLETFQASLEHEQYMTSNLNELSDLAMKEKDHATYNFLQWYVTEQVEEEATVSDIIAKIKLIGGDGNGLFMIDNELSGRVAPAALDAGQA